MVSVLCRSFNRPLSSFALGYAASVYIPFSTIIAIEVKDPAFESGKFGEIKNLLIAMLETYRYERTLLDTTLNLLARDRHRSLVSLRRNVMQGIAPRSQLCAVCKQSILCTSPSDSPRLVLFSCGTAYHKRCMMVELSVGLNPRFDQDRRSFETSLKGCEYRDGLLSSMSSREEENNHIRDRARTSSYPKPFNPNDFSLKTKHPPIKL